jgi:hypothetical protein
MHLTTAAEKNQPAGATWGSGGEMRRGIAKIQKRLFPFIRSLIEVRMHAIVVL